MLPLFDGVFATLLVSGYLQSLTSIVNVAFTIFAGAGALTIVLSEAGSARNAQKMVLKSAPMLLAGAIMTGLLAPAIESILYLERLQLISGLTVGIIAFQIADIKLIRRIPVPLLLVLGIIVSLQPNPQLTMTAVYIAPSILTISFALAGLLIASALKGRINIEYMRKGGVIVLLIISASLLGLNIPSGTGLVVLTISTAAAFLHTSELKLNVR
jgi:hypothetical protein